MTLRAAVPEDAESLLAIYAPYVRDTAVTLEYDVPTADEFRARIEATLKGYPYLVCEEDGVPLGYAYAGRLKPRAGYAYSCELSVYVRADAHGRGIGRALYTALEHRLKEQGIRNLYACIVSPDGEDPYVTDASERFHTRMGFVRCAEFRRCAFKFGRWYNVIWMEKFTDAEKD